MSNIGDFGEKCFFMKEQVYCLVKDTAVPKVDHDMRMS